MRRKMITVGICLIIFILSGCGVRATTTPPTQPTDSTDSTPTELPSSETVTVDSQLTDATTARIQTDTFEGVIFNDQMAQESSVQFLRNNIDGFWTPTQEDVLQLEAGLAAYLQQTAKPEHERIWQELPDYKRPYVGITQDGQPSIYTNFFCTEFDNWEDTLVDVDDGGKCFFQVQYSVENDQFFDLQVNGEA
ncbi:MAG: hypothetical protein GFH27_549325n66 [Chloroflexi bacterium AL-W]|nr:hypothetical protein [Chloroflexi bacterium AL-N1]NOK70084.1 hypothetical protein [Chloroflexi bacterium AL-N10]NOK77904.1 hypothetical protein [Chloroflexi bacterium AL-N5]NOK84913.1 hypothetical protein [Chloroflexi bacterium AL-W]NOK91892.1 hypothetical protein [Chloroflexi bacterium AL-N15]